MSRYPKPLQTKRNFSQPIQRMGFQRSTLPYQRPSQQSMETVVEDIPPESKSQPQVPSTSNPQTQQTSPRTSTTNIPSNENEQQSPPEEQNGKQPNETVPPLKGEEPFKRGVSPKIDTRREMSFGVIGDRSAYQKAAQNQQNTPTTNEPTTPTTPKSQANTAPGTINNAAFVSQLRPNPMNTSSRSLTKTPTNAPVPRKPSYPQHNRSSPSVKIPDTVLNEIRTKAVSGSQNGNPNVVNLTTPTVKTPKSEEKTDEIGDGSLSNDITLSHDFNDSSSTSKNSHVIGYIKKVTRKINDQYKVKGSVDLMLNSGFIYFSFKPMKYKASEMRRRHVPMVDINEYQTSFPFNLCVGIKYKMIKKGSLKSTHVYIVSFEFSTILPYTVPSFQFKNAEDVEEMFQILTRNGMKITAEKVDEKEGSYKVTQNKNNERLRKSIADVALFSKKVRSDPSRSEKQKKWLEKATIGRVVCNKYTLDAQHQKGNLQQTVKYGGCDNDSRCIAWMICNDLMTKYELKYDIMVEWENKYKCLLNQWEMFLPEQKMLWSDIDRIEKQINKDIGRTKLENITWTTTPIDSLKNILLAVSIYDMELGFVQGMNEICGLIMRYCNSELETFIILHMIMKVMKPTFLIQSSAPKELNRIKHILRIVDPMFYQIFEEAEIDYMFCWRSIALMFKREIKEEEIIRVWDFIFSSPEDKMYLFIMVAILQLHKEYFISQTVDYELCTQFMISLDNMLDKEIMWDADIVLSDFKAKASDADKEIVFGK